VGGKYLVELQALAMRRVELQLDHAVDPGAVGFRYSSEFALVFVQLDLAIQSPLHPRWHCSLLVCEVPDANQEVSNGPTMLPRRDIWA